MTLFGFKFAGEDTLHTISEQKYSRFEPKQERQNQIRVVHTRNQPEPPTTRSSLPEAFMTKRATVTQNMSDHLHSEVGISPSILRKALPQRFQKLDAERYSTGPDIFDFARASA